MTCGGGRTSLYPSQDQGLDPPVNNAAAPLAGPGAGEVAPDSCPSVCLSFRSTGERLKQRRNIIAQGSQLLRAETEAI